MDVVIELDDDGLLIADDVFPSVQQLFAAEPKPGIIGFRVADEHGHTERRCVPRLRAEDPMRRGIVTAFLGGGHAFPVPMLNEIGLWLAEFFFGHEESDLAWRSLDVGWRSCTSPSSSFSTRRPPRLGTRCSCTTGSPPETGCGSPAVDSRRRCSRSIWACGFFSARRPEPDVMRLPRRRRCRAGRRRPQSARASVTSPPALARRCPLRPYGAPQEAGHLADAEGLVKSRTAADLAIEVLPEGQLSGVDLQHLAVPHGVPDFGVGMRTLHEQA